MNNIFKNLLHRENSVAYIFIFPALLGIFIFIFIPIVISFILSFTHWDLLNPIQFVGFNNYIQIFNDKLFGKIMFNTFIYAISTSFLGIMLPLIIANMLNNKIRGGEFFKTVMFLPFITPMIVIGIIWNWIFDPNIGFLNQILNTHIHWLGDSHFALPALIIISVWKLIGYNMIIFLASLSTISQSYFEAAKIDGANNFQIFKNITIPMLSPTIFFVVIITTISTFQVFDLVYVMTQGGPFDSTNVLVYSIYKYAFEYFEIGTASAYAYILFFIVLILTLLQWYFRKKLVYNEID